MSTDELADEYLDLMGQVVTNAPFNQAQEYSRGELAALRMLELREGGEHPMTPGELSQELGLTTARIANLLKSLERKGLVRRDHDSEDRRRVFVTLTDAGRAFGREKQQEMHTMALRLIDHMGEDDAREFVRLLGRMVTFGAEDYALISS